jgi:hypothetical protein
MLQVPGLGHESWSFTSFWRSSTPRALWNLVVTVSLETQWLEAQQQDQTDTEAVAAILKESRSFPTVLGLKCQ